MVYCVAAHAVFQLSLTPFSFSVLINLCFSSKLHFSSTPPYSLLCAQVEIHSKLRNPHILRVLSYFEDEDKVYLVLEYCEKGELNRFLQRRGYPFTEAEAKQLIVQIVNGMTYLQKHQILHRDLSLGNMLLTSAMAVKIADFGLATKLTHADEKHLTMCGTPNFISPEIVSQTPHGLAADVWSLGCMIYTLLVGKAPFDTDDIKSTLKRFLLRRMCKA